MASEKPLPPTSTAVDDDGRTADALVGYVATAVWDYLKAGTINKNAVLRLLPWEEGLEDKFPLPTGYCILPQLAQDIFSASAQQGVPWMTELALAWARGFEEHFLAARVHRQSDRLARPFAISLRPMTRAEVTACLQKDDLVHNTLPGANDPSPFGWDQSTVEERLPDAQAPCALAWRFHRLLAWAKHADISLEALKSLLLTAVMPAVGSKGHDGSHLDVRVEATSFEDVSVYVWCRLWQTRTRHMQHSQKGVPRLFAESKGEPSAKKGKPADGDGDE